MSDVKITTVYQTDNYDKFRFVDGNRPINHAKKIIESISEIGMLWQPILVNERYEIIDGQGRFLAMKTLHLPILYIKQNGLGIKEVRYLNKNSTNWRVDDYIRSYSHGADARESYINYEAVKKQFPEFQQRTIMRAASEYGLTTNSSQAIKNGTYDGMDIEQMNTAIRRLAKLREISASIPTNMKSRSTMLDAIVFCEYLAEVDASFSISQLHDAIKKNLDLISPARNLGDAIKNLDYMYNYKRLERNKYKIFRKYEDVSAEIRVKNLPGERIPASKRKKK